MIGILTALLLFSSEASAFQKCYRDGLCLGHLIEVVEYFQESSILECVEHCRSISGCNYASYHKNAYICTLNKSCTRVVLKDSVYQYSSTRCKGNLPY